MCIKNFKKTFITFVATLVMMFALVACSIGATSTEATEARKNLKNAVDQIALEHTMDLNNVVDNIKLNGVLVQFGAKVTWESSDENHLKIEADGANYIAKVTRPQPSEENVQVTLTATISVEYTDTDGTTKSVSDEKSYTLTIIKSEPAETLTDAKAKAAAELAANGKTEYSTNFYATVTAVMKDGQQFFVTDGTTGIYVYIACEGIKVGDVVNVQGVFSTYYGTLQIAKDGGAVTVLEADAEGLYHDEFGNVLYTAEGPLKSLQGEEAYAQDITVSDLVNQDTADGCFGGQAATLYGKLVHEKYLANTYDNYFLIDPYTAERVLVYYKSFTKDDEALLAPYLGQYVTINVATYDQKNEDGMGIVKRVAIVAESVKAAEAPTMTDEEKLANLLAGLQLPGTVESEYTLSTEAAWEVVEGNATIENGVLKVTQTAEEQTVVVRATVTVGELSDTKEFTITVPSSKIEVLTPTQAAAGLQDAANDGLVLHVGGFVAEGSKLDKYGNFVLEDAQGGSVVIYGGFGKDAEGNYLFPSIQEQLGIEVGVYVVVKGKYTTNYNNVTGTEIVSVSVDATKATAGLADAANDGLEVLVHGTIAEGSKLDKYGNFVLEDANGGTVTIYGGFGKDAEGNYLFPSIQEQLGLAVGVKVVVRGTYTVNYKNITGLEILMAMAAGETPEPEEHVHTACPECGKCTAEDCTGTEEEKCAGHEVEPEQPQSGVAELTVNSLGIASQTYAAGTATINGVAFEFIQIGNYGDGIQMRDKNGNTSQLWNTSAFGAGIVKIELTYSASKDVTYANADAVIFTFGNSAKEAAYTTKLSTAAGVKSYTITPDASTYTFFYLEHDLGYTFYWESIKVYFAAGGETPEQPEVPTHEHDLCPECGKCLKEDCPEEKCAGHEVEPETPAFGVVAAPVAGTAYKFGMVQGNLNKTYYLVGGMDGYYMATTEDASAALDVYLEATEGGYYLYCMVNGVKTYINMVVSGTHVNGAYEATASTVHTYNEESKTVIAVVNNTEYWYGTRNDKTYTTVGPCAVSYAGFYCQFYGATTGETPEQPEVPTHEHDLCPECGKCLKEDCPEEKCAGHEVEPETPVTAGGKADLETMDPATTNGGTGQYSKPLTSTSGWYCENSALLIGGTSDANPTFIFIGADNTTKAVTINGKTAAKGFLKSPTLAGGISKLTFNYGHAFKEANGVNITITITEVATGNKVELTLVKTNAEVVQKTAYVAEFVLDAPIVGEFTIEFTNNSPTNSSSSNKDRVSLWNIEWVGAAA